MTELPPQTSAPHATEAMNRGSASTHRGTHANKKNQHACEVDLGRDGGGEVREADDVREEHGHAVHVRSLPERTLTVTGATLYGVCRRNTEPRPTLWRYGAAHGEIKRKRLRSGLSD
eukprot:1863421-Rhodomonas_salina.3